MPSTVSPPEGIVNPHGPGSFFGDLAITGMVSSALALPKGGIMRFLPRTNGSLPQDLMYAIMTGITPGEVGDAAADGCDKPSHSTGLAKLCTQVARFGRIEIEDKGVSLRCFEPPSACETLDIRLQGNPLDPSQSSGIINMDGMGVGDNLNDPGVKRMLELYASLIRQYSPYIWESDGADTGDPSWCPPKGLLNFIHDKHVDAIDPSIECERANSYVLDAECMDLCTQEGVDNLYGLILNMVHTLQDRAERFGLNPVVWLPSMHPTLFRLITRMWPCAMSTCGCATSTMEGPIQINLNDPVSMANEMYTGGYLWVDGQRIFINMDDTMPKVDDGSGMLTSTIAWVPFTVNGGTPVTFVDYARWDRTHELGGMAMQNVLASSGGRIIDNGRWLVLQNPITRGCGGEYLLSARPRMLMYTPQIAGKIINVCYKPDYQYTEWNPTEPGYLNGGQTAQPLPDPLAK